MSLPKTQENTENGTFQAYQEGYITWYQEIFTNKAQNNPYWKEEEKQKREYWYDGYFQAKSKSWESRQKMFTWWQKKHAPNKLEN